MLPHYPKKKKISMYWQMLCYFLFDLLKDTSIVNANEPRCCYILNNILLIFLTFLLILIQRSIVVYNLSPKRIRSKAFEYDNFI